MIEILSNGASNLVEDLGRPAHVGIGVSAGGAMDASALSLANCMVGNDETSAGIEISTFPFRIKLHQDTYFACTGAATSVTLPHRNLPSWWAAQARAGDVLKVEAPTHGARAYLAFTGGVDVPLVLGSRSTDLKGSFGGLEGRGLRKGDHLSLVQENSSGAAHTGPVGIAPDSRIQFASQLASGTVRIRVMSGAEYRHFTEDAATAFELSEYRVTPDRNRQGYRLEGVALKTRRTLDLLSHGIVPGTVHVPPAGQPIIQLAEANTCGGYPKIATVIEADLWRVAQLREGQRIRFELVDREAAVNALRELAREHSRIQQGLELMGRRREESLQAINPTKHREKVLTAVLTPSRSRSP
ncbi:biotin-dependent carboxyltransferase family protein [Ramlibacter sp. WS9]|uniref:5-oxoprolinase subunit C family protein n=1 Tax=Ramlibacter sp. WS9 TaxID=1882741 RepID=UPI0011417F7A|nr:biotin-dependent carboxyltransferase family protein [Ramlibacter sp. WS9]ROZ78012.1 biotin-dependent carboxyltransferase [Ramlibacter sp. WS9]